MVAAGSLDRRVTIERETVTGEDELGQPIKTWATWETRWMSKRDVTARERFRAQQPLAEETTVWEARDIPGLLTTDRLLYEGQTYNIDGIAEMDRRAGIEILTTAVRVP